MRRLTTIFALFVIVGGGCRREPPKPPESKGDGKADGSAERGPGLEAFAIPDVDDPAPTGPRTRPKAAEVESRTAADKAVTTGNPDGAAVFLRTHVAAHPKEEEARFQLARAERLLGHWAEAKRTLEPLCKSKNAKIATRALRTSAALTARLGDVSEADRLLGDAITRAPDELANKGALLAHYHATGRHLDPPGRKLGDELYAAYGSGSALTPDDFLAVARATLAEETGGGYKDANKVLGEAEKKVDGGSELADEILLLRAEIFLQKYNAEDSLATLSLLLERDPWHPDALALLAEVQAVDLSLAAASRAAEEALQVDAGHPDAHAVLARIALIEGRRDEAKKRLETHVFTRSPAHTDGLMVLAGLSVFEGDTQGYASAEKRVLAHNPRNWQFYTGLADVLGFLHLYPEANRVLEGASEDLRRHPHMRSAYGLNALRLGHEAPAREAIDQAFKKDRFNERTLNTITLYDERIGVHYEDVTRGDLTVRMPKRERGLLQAHFEGAIGRARGLLDKAYGVHPSPMRIEVFETSEDFSVRTIGTPALGAVGVCFGPVITALGPYDGILNFDQVIHHEIAHVYAIELSKGRVPRWFTEGLSEWESELADPSWARENARLLMEARRRGKLRKLHELELAFLRAESALMMEVAYSTATYAVRYLGETYGRPKLVAMLRGYASGASTETLMEKHLGKKMAEIETDFEAWFGAELDKRVSGFVPRAVVDAHAVVSERGAESDADKRERLFLEGVELAGAGKMDEAHAKFGALVKAGGDGFAARYGLARTLMRKDKKAAMAELEKARTFDKESIEPLVELAALARDQDDIAKEMDFLSAAVDIDAMTFDPVARLLMLTMVMDDPRQARVLDRAIAIAPLHPMVLAAQAGRLAKKDRKRAEQFHAATLAALEGREDGPADTFVVAAIAAKALGDKVASARLAATALERGDALPSKAKAKMKALAG